VYLSLWRGDSSFGRSYFSLAVVLPTLAGFCLVFQFLLLQEAGWRIP